MTPEQRVALITATGGYNSPSAWAPGGFAARDQWVALGWFMPVVESPQQIAWLVQGYYTVGRDMVKGY